MREIVGKALAEFLAGVDDLDQVVQIVAREKVIRDTMARTGEGREVVADMADAMASMGHEEVLELTDGEPTTMRDAVSRYVSELEKLPEDYRLTVAEVADNLTTILNYPWSGEEERVQLHNPHYGLALHIDEGDNRDLEIRMGSNRHLVYTVNWEDAGSGGQRECQAVAEVVYRATLARVIADRDHHVDLSRTDRDALVEWLARPSGSIRLGYRLTLDAGGPAGVIVRTRPYSHQYLPPVPPLDKA